MFLNTNSFHITLSNSPRFREDHFDGINAIYRFAACVPIDESTSSDGVYRQVKSLKKELSRLKVRANRINICSDMLEIDFFTRGFQMAMNRTQYLGLQVEFAEFLINSNISKITIQDGFYGDDPEYSAKLVDNSEVNFFPEFNAQCFGANTNDPIEVYDDNGREVINKWL